MSQAIYAQYRRNEVVYAFKSKDDSHLTLKIFRPDEQKRIKKEFTAEQIGASFHPYMTNPSKLADLLAILSKNDPSIDFSPSIEKDSLKSTLSQPSLVMSENIKIVIFAPEKDADAVRKAIGEAGAGRIGLYDYCSFSTYGVGRYRPLDGSQPESGEIGKFEKEPEIRIETICSKDQLQNVIEAAKKHILMKQWDMIFTLFLN